MNIRKQLYELNKMSKKSVALYHKFALSIGISDSALGVLYALLEAEKPCSQYELCNEWDIPKQTVNSAVTALKKKDFVSLSPISGTRNKKSVSLTENGRKFAEKTVGLLHKAELSALAELSSQERELYIKLNRKYNNSLNEKLLCVLDEGDI